MVKGCHVALVSKYYFKATKEVAEFLSTYFAVAFLEEFAKYEKAFKTGVWYIEDPGPWLGCVIIYKLQVDCHQDQQNGGLTAIFNVGQYKGGFLYFPDLSLKLEYIFLFLMQFLFKLIV